MAQQIKALAGKLDDFSLISRLYSGRGEPVSVNSFSFHTNSYIDTHTEGNIVENHHVSGVHVSSFRQQEVV